MMQEMDKRDELPQIIECLLFAAGDPVPPKRLAELCEVDEAQVEEAVVELATRLEDHGLQVLRVAGGYTLGTRPEYATWVHRLRQPPAERLSAAALEVLAIIAYRQPITKPEIDQIRGVDSGSALRSLVAKRLVTTRGRKEGPGRAPLYVTTEYFLRAFGLNDLSELPEAPEGLPARARQMRLMAQEASAEQAEQQVGEREATATDHESGSQPASAVAEVKDGQAGGGPEMSTELADD